MKTMKNFVWIIVSILMVLSLLLVSCGTTTTEQEEEEEVSEKELVKLTLTKLDGTTMEKWVEEPQYGGTFVTVQGRDLQNWDDFYANPSSCYGTQLTNEEMMTGDWYRGPAGTEETTWYAGTYWTDLQRGCLAESYEIPDASTIIFHIRPGIHWQNKPPMNGREFTAEDAAYSFTRLCTDPTTYQAARVGVGKWFESATATDRYTVVVKGKDTTSCKTGKAFIGFADNVFILPPEVIEEHGNMVDWETVVGTGPFMVTDLQVGSSVTFERNPDYWMHDPLFPENQLPYLDGRKFLIITDASTRLAALRTGKIDLLANLLWEDAEAFQDSNPELGWYREFPIGSDLIFLRVDKSPFTDINVRQALHMAVNFEAITEHYYGGHAVTLGFPAPPVKEFEECYIPLDELSPSVRELYECNQEKAKQILDEAGYPDGFTFKVLCTSRQADLLSIIKDDLSKIDVNMELDTQEGGTYASILFGSKDYEATVGGYAQKFVYDGQYWTKGDQLNFGFIDDPVLLEANSKIGSYENIGNDSERHKIIRGFVEYLINQAYAIDPPLPYSYRFWQPWAKNCFGLTSVGSVNWENPGNYVWIDEGLKAASSK